jgi:transaldolase
VAQAQVAYQHFLQQFSGPRWEALAAKGARVQRPLWASTSTKNPAAFADHGTVARTIDADGAAKAAAAHLQELTDVGIDLEDVAVTLERDGVASFAKSFTDLLQSLTDKAATFS